MTALAGVELELFYRKSWHRKFPRIGILRNNLRYENFFRFVETSDKATKDRKIVK